MFDSEVIFYKARALLMEKFQAALDGINAEKADGVTAVSVPGQNFFVAPSFNAGNGNAYIECGFGDADLVQDAFGGGHSRRVNLQYTAVVQDNSPQQAESNLKVLLRYQRAIAQVFEGNSDFLGGYSRPKVARFDPVFNAASGGRINRFAAVVVGFDMAT
jgi:hypothetical protein